MSIYLHILIHLSFFFFREQGKAEDAQAPKEEVDPKTSVSSEYFIYRGTDSRTIQNHLMKCLDEYDTVAPVGYGRHSRAVGGCGAAGRTTKFPGEPKVLTTTLKGK